MKRFSNLNSADSEIESLLGPAPIAQDQKRPDLVSEADLADLLGVTSRSIRDAASNGVLRRVGPGLYDRRAAVRAYVERLQKLAQKRGNTDPEYQAARTRVATAQAEALETKAAVARGELILAADVERGWFDVLRQVRGAMLAISSRVQQRLPTLSPTDVSEIDHEIRAALEECAK